jgi:PAS domain S-box-containing protein
LAKEAKSYVANLEHLVGDRSQALRIEQEVGTLWLEHTFDLAVMADAGGKVVRASASHATQLGYSRDDLLGRDALFMAHPDDRASCNDALRSTAAGSVSPRFVRLRHKDGHYETFALHGACVENDLDEPVYSLAVMRKCEPAAAKD